MLHNIANTSTSTSALTASLPTVEQVKAWSRDDFKTFLQGNRTRLDLEDEDINKLHDQRVKGDTFLALKYEMLVNPPLSIPVGPAIKLVELINKIQGEQSAVESNAEENKKLRYENFHYRFSNTQNSASLYRLLHNEKIIKRWEIEMEIDITKTRTIGEDAFEDINELPPDQGSKEIEITQPFCLRVVTKINEYVGILEPNDLYVFGDRIQDQVYPDILIGLDKFYSELTAKPPDLSKGLGWEVKNDLRDNSKLTEGKGQLIKYARAYLSADRPLTNTFYGCVTDGKLWQFVKIKLFSDDFNNLKFNFEESINYEWNKRTASIIAGIIFRYRKDLSMKASGEKKESQNNDETYMYRNKSSISSESLLASFIEEGIYIRLINSENYIHVQIISHLGTGRNCIIFLAQVRDYGIKDAVLKIEIRKDIEFYQVYREISALRALSDLSCVPKILFEGYTLGDSLALLTDFAGQPLESWISNNDNIDDYTIFQIILDLLSCLKKIHAHGYTHGDVAMRNVIQRNGHFYLIDFGLATPLQLHSDPRQAIIQDYSGLCQIIGTIKFGKEMTLSELIDKLEGELKSLVVFVENASRWKITDERKWLENFGAIVKQSYERSSRKALLEITENINNS